MPVTQKQVDDLEEGDYVKARFQQTKMRNRLERVVDVHPTGYFYILSGTITVEKVFGKPSLYVGLQCIRQGDGRPGGWLEEIIEHRPAK